MNIGQNNTLTVQGKNAYGLLLVCDQGAEALLPAQQAPASLKIGDTVDVFVFTDADGKAIATTQTPLVSVGQTALLKVVSATDAGYWLDWGLPQDLLLPRSEQRKHRGPGRSTGQQIFVYVFLDEQTGKICATTRFHRHFAETGRHFKAGEKVRVTIADKTELGFKVIINARILGLLFEDQTHRAMQVGESVDGFVKRIRPDGKVDITLYASTPHQVTDLEQRIVRFLRDAGGQSSLGDKSTPEAIFKQFQVSKKHYKRALGSLYKARLINIDGQHIKLLEPTSQKTPRK